MALIEDTQFDVGELVLGFGKHKGTKLKDAPQEYLFFMFTSFDQGGFWKDKAELELRRRKRVAEHGQDIPPCTYDVVEQLSKTKLLRAFITRRNQSLGIYAWSQEFVVEIRRHGQRITPTEISYLDYIFDFEYTQNRYVLINMRPGKHD